MSLGMEVGLGLGDCVRWGPRSPPLPKSDILIYAAIWPQQIWAKNWEGGCAPLGEGSWIPILHNVARAKAYLHAKFHLDPTHCYQEGVRQFEARFQGEAVVPRPIY